MSGPLSRGCFREKTSPPKKGERSFSSQTLKVWQLNTNPISIAWGSHLKKHPTPQGVFNIPVMMDGITPNLSSKIIHQAHTKHKGGGYESQTLRYGKGKTNPIHYQTRTPPFFGVSFNLSQIRDPNACPKKFDIISMFGILHPFKLDFRDDTPTSQGSL